MHGFSGKSMNEILYPVNLKSVMGSMNPAFVTLENAGKGIYTGASANLDYRFIALKTLALLSGIDMQSYGLVLYRLHCTDHNSFNNFVTSRPLRFAVDKINWKNVSVNINETYRMIFQVEKKWKILNTIIYTEDTESMLIFPYDMAIFSIIHCLFADVLGLNIGKLTYISTSIFNESGYGVNAPESEEFLSHIVMPRYTIETFHIDEGMEDNSPMKILYNISEEASQILNRILNLKHSIDDIKDFDYKNDKTLIGLYMDQFIHWIKWNGKDRNIENEDVSVMEVG